MEEKTDKINEKRGFDMSQFQIPEGFCQAEKAMQAYFNGMEKGYTVEGKDDQMTVTDAMSGYWADIDLNKAEQWRFCTDEDVPEEGMLRFFYGDRDWELLFLGDESLKEILGVSRIRLVAFRKTAKIRDY